MLSFCREEDLCPYEISIILARKANVIVGDYYYLFNPTIRDVLLNKLNIQMEDIIAIVDEAHNLPNRIRDLMTARLSNLMVKRGINEAKKYEYDNIKGFLEHLSRILQELPGELQSSKEKILKKEDFINRVEGFTEYDMIIKEMNQAGEAVRELQKQSSIGSIGSFLEDWKGDDDGYARIISKREDLKGKTITLSYHCLDPSLVTKDALETLHSTILMSGTLTPTSMYRDILGCPSNTKEKEYRSPFSEDNKLVLINPTVTTKFSERSTAQFERIAGICSEMVNKVPGNSVIFFPSYMLKEQISQFLIPLSHKTIFEERNKLSKEEKDEMIQSFIKYKDSGAVLLGVTSGSFGEGIDLPGDLLKSVIIVGLPLQPPDLLIKELIRYYDLKFGRGWDYGYTLPAVTKSLQNAGRCIRSETDRGVVAFLDKRYILPNYRRCFPKEWNLNITADHIKMIGDFFNG